jgi:ATP-dependent Clp protease protease subunit
MAVIEKDSAISLILDDGIDYKNRRIYFGATSQSMDDNGSEFSWRSCERAIRAIHFMESESPHKPIELHMSSPGGEANEMLRLVDVIECSPCQIKFFGGGQIMSAATWIMAVCDERYLYRNTRVLIHDSPSGYIETPTKLSDRRIDMRENNDLQNRLNQLYANNSRMPVEFFQNLVKRDCYLSAEETIALGLADKIIEPKKRGNLRRMRISLLNREVDKSELTKLVKKLFARIEENRLPSKIEIHIVKEDFDKNIFVDDTKENDPTQKIELGLSEPER